MLVELLSFIQEIDLQILNLIQQYFKSVFMDKFMVFITNLGNRGIIWLIISLIFMTRKEYRKISIYSILALILVTILGELVLKNIVDRVRPFEIVEQMELLIKKPVSSSFPSGHTASSFTMAGVLSHKIRKYKITFYILASLIAFSRLYLFVHNPTDIVAGIVLSVVCSNFVIFLYENKK